MDYQHLLVQHLALVDRLVRFVARRHHLSNLDADEFASIVRFKLVDRDFLILRKFEGRSSLDTYLAVVIERLCLDFCVAKWGKWRPSAIAQRLGPVAIMLEQLTGRDGITFDEAVGTLQTNHGVSETRAELHALFIQLPPGMRRRRHSPSGSDDDDRGGGSVPPVDHRDDEHLVDRVHAALADAFRSLSADDRRIVRLRFEDSLPIVDIARVLGIETKPLYRRLAHIIRALRLQLLQRGIEEAEIARLIGHPTLELPGVLVDRAKR